MKTHSSGSHFSSSGLFSSPYTQLVMMGFLHLPIMYLIMFVMVDTLGDVFHNLNTFYMAMMMAAPMVLLMPIFMKAMYPNKKMNLFVYLCGATTLLAFYYFVRAQTFIDDRQFIRSMIPHHSGAILMCQEAQLSDNELKTLCEEIIAAQREEIDQMKSILDRLD